MFLRINILCKKVRPVFSKISISPPHENPAKNETNKFKYNKPFVGAATLSTVSNKPARMPKKINNEKVKAKKGRVTKYIIAPNVLILSVLLTFTSEFSLLILSL